MVLSVEDFKLTINCRDLFPSCLLLKLLFLAHLSKPAPYPPTIFRNTYQYLYKISQRSYTPTSTTFPKKHQQSFTEQRWHHSHHLIDWAAFPRLQWNWPLDIMQTTVKGIQTFRYPRYGRLQRGAPSNESWAQVELTNTLLSMCPLDRPNQFWPVQHHTKYLIPPLMVCNPCIVSKPQQNATNVEDTRHSTPIHLVLCKSGPSSANYTVYRHYYCVSHTPQERNSMCGVVLLCWWAFEGESDFWNRVSFIWG